MLKGVVTANREAVLPLRLRGTADLEAVIEAVIDTGFTDELTLPLSWVTALNLPYLLTDDVTLADGSTIGVDLYEVTVLWEDRERPAIVHCLEGSPVIGMSLLYDYLLTMQVTEGGQVTLEALPSGESAER